MFRLIRFIVLCNGFIIAMLHGSFVLLNTPQLNFVSDYFFYALVIQWSLGTVLMVGAPRRLSHLKHSPAKATRVAASMADTEEQSRPSSIDLTFSNKLFLSGAFALLACLFL